MNNHSKPRRNLASDEDADARIGAFFAISAILTVVMAAAYIIAPPPNIGIEEGALAPDIIGESYSAGTWSDFRLYDVIDRSWEEGQEGEWVFLQFLDTDCGHCWTAGSEMSQLYSEYGQYATFISVAVEVVGDGHSKAEIAAFKDKTDREGCSGNSNCMNRPGEVHPWAYVDALDGKAQSDYGIPGTPFELLLSPDGVVVWNSAQGAERGEDIAFGLYQNLVAVEE
ncbi:MAG: hypothetical protein VX320_00680 [Candidatus Thermoplasmatota archaeon]|nr:hypothetical protein [Candidatus Thermoplasmatota archaeon]